MQKTFLRIIFSLGFTAALCGFAGSYVLLAVILFEAPVDFRNAPAYLFLGIFPVGFAGISGMKYAAKKGYLDDWRDFFFPGVPVWFRVVFQVYANLFVAVTLCLRFLVPGGEDLVGSLAFIMGPSVFYLVGVGGCWAGLLALHKTDEEPAVDYEEEAEDSLLKRYQSSFLGLALGDASAAPFEGGPLARLLWMIISIFRMSGSGKMQSMYSDDTRMSMDVAECLVANGGINQDNLARRFAGSYHWWRGYGPGAAKILRKIRDGADWREVNRGQFPEGSFGNGGAMRAPVIGLAFCGDDAAIVENVRKSCEITHPNPLAIEGATLVALATAWRLEDKPVEVIMRDLMAYVTLPEFRERLEIAGKWLETSEQINLRKIRKRLGNKITAHQSSVTAIYIALGCKGMAFRKMIRYIIRLKGDTDTIAAMAGAIWGAGGDFIADGQLNPKIVENGQKIVELAAELHQFSGDSQTGCAN